MQRRLIQVLILTVTFAAGFGVATFRSHRKLSPPPPITFSCDGIVSAFRTHYHSSVGQHLRYGCYEHSSTAEAERYLHDEIRPNYKYIGSTPVQIVSRTVTFDGSGNQSGERAVLDSGEIFWTEGPRFHLISAPSVEYALLFENSRSWAWEGCMKLPPRNDASE